jgi:GTP-binding protein
MAENLAVHSVVFLKSASRLSESPDTGSLPELAIAGRSNVGKSSLINRLVNRRQLARVSNTPGRTQLLNFFRVNDTFVLCDLPGYGYAKVPWEMRSSWGDMIGGYLERRTPLRALLLLVDCRREPGQWERDLAAFCSTRGLALVTVVTKVDKLPKSKRFESLSRIARSLGVPPEALVAFSSETGEGLDLLWRRVVRVLNLGQPEANP